MKKATIAAIAGIPYIAAAPAEPAIEDQGIFRKNTFWQNSRGLSELPTHVSGIKRMKTITARTSGISVLRPALAIRYLVGANATAPPPCRTSASAAFRCS
jgi:hypothetical protein